MKTRILARSRAISIWTSVVSSKFEPAPCRSRLVWELILSRERERVGQDFCNKFLTQNTSEVFDLKPTRCRVAGDYPSCGLASCEREPALRRTCHNHFVFDDQIGAEPGVDPDVLVGYGDGLLSGTLKSSPGEFMRQDSIVDRFQQSRSEGGVDAERASTFMADSIISRQAAEAQRTHPAREA